MFAAIDRTETKSRYDSHVKLNEHLASSGAGEDSNGFEGVVGPSASFGAALKGEANGPVLEARVE